MLFEVTDFKTGCDGDKHLPTSTTKQAQNNLSNRSEL